jgi:hypothetical protein
MEKKELGLVASVYLNSPSGTLRVQNGDMLRENATSRVVKVVSVYRRYTDGEYFIECENQDPGSNGQTKFLPTGAVSFLMG